MLMVNIMLSASNELDKYSFRREIGRDLESKGYKLIHLETIPQEQTYWKGQWDMDYFHHRKTAYRKIVVVAEEGMETEHCARYHYHSLWPNSIEYDPPLLSENKETSDGKIDW